MFFSFFIAHLASLCLSVNEVVIADPELVDALQIEGVPTNTDWNGIISELQDGISVGDRHAQIHIESTQNMDDAEKEVANETYREKLMAKFRKFFRSERKFDIYRAAFVIGAVANGIVGQLRNDIVTSHKGSFLIDPSTIGTEAMKSLMVTSYAFAIQGLMLAMLAPLDRDALPMQLSDAPKAALLGGVFASLATFSFVVSAPILGLTDATLLYVFSQVATGLCFDRTGVNGLLPKRRISRAELLGVLSMGGGIVSTLDLGSLAGGAERSLALTLPLLGVPILGGASATTGVSFNSALAPYAGSPLKAGMVAYFMGALATMTMSLILYAASGTPSITLEGSQWWQWVGCLVGIYTVYTSAALPPRLGVATFISVSGGAFSISSVVADTVGLSGHKKPLTPLRVLGVALSVVGMVVVQLFPGAVIRKATIRGTRTMTNAAWASPKSTVYGRSTAHLSEYVEEVDASVGRVENEVVSANVDAAEGSNADPVTVVADGSPLSYEAVDSPVSYANVDSPVSYLADGEDIHV